MLIAGVVSAVATAALFLLRRRRLGSGDEARQVQRALKSGEVPQGANRPKWRSVTDDSIRISRRFRNGIATLGTLTVCLSVGSALLIASNRLYALILAAAFVVVTVSADVVAHQNLKRARRLRQQLV